MENNNRRDLEEPLLENKPKNENDGDPFTEAFEGGGEGNEFPSSSSLPSIQRMVMMARPEFGVLALSAVLMVVSQVTLLIIPILVGQAYDELVDSMSSSSSNSSSSSPSEDSQTMSHIHRLMITALCFHVSGSVAGWFRGALMGIAGERIVARMRVSLYASILRQEIGFFDATHSGDLVSRLGSDTLVVKQAISSSWAEVCLGLLRLVATLSLMFVLSAKLAGLTLGSTLLVFLASLPLGRALGRLSKHYQDVLGQAQNYPTETIGAMRTVKAFAAEHREAQRYAEVIGRPSFFPFSSFSFTTNDDNNNNNNNKETTFSIGYRQSILRAIFGFLVVGGGMGSLLGTLWYGFVLVHAGELRIGDLTAFQAYVFGIGATLARLSSSVSSLVEARYASQRIFEMLDRQPKISDNQDMDMDVDVCTNVDMNINMDIDMDINMDVDVNTVANSTVATADTNTDNETETETFTTSTDIKKGSSFHDKKFKGGNDTDTNKSASSKSNKNGSSSTNLHGTVSFENVSFAYPSRPNAPVLRDFTLHIPQNKTTAIVGPSGAGKSTLISLLERFHDVDQGSIRYDGVDVRRFPLQALRRRLGYVQQEPILFGMSIRDNLRYGIDTNTTNISSERGGGGGGDEEEFERGPRIITDDDLLDACRTANAYDFVSRLPQGLDETVGERGVKLSGGQKQRLAIARAILLDPAVLLLDEATSALDAESEYLVQQAMDAASKGRTVIVVAHRLSTIQKADQIVVLENHTLQDVGTHDELMHRCETYQKLIARQSFGTHEPTHIASPPSK